MELSYIKLLDNIKMSLFSGDHSGIYMLVCAAACICASFSLISWYNKMLNEPYGQLDMSAVIRTVAILILICNFYSLVLIPFDFMTTTLTRGLTAYVDDDKSGMTGQIASLFESVETEYANTTLSGEFRSSVASETADTADDSGFSYGSNALMESIYLHRPCIITDVLYAARATRDFFAENEVGWCEGRVSKQVSIAESYFNNPAMLEDMSKRYANLPLEFDSDKFMNQIIRDTEEYYNKNK